MGFFILIYTIMLRTTICSNPWCKAQFNFNEGEFVDVDGKLQEPKQCKKCMSFNSDLSAGVTWQEREYEGERYTNEPHQIRYKITNYKL